MAGHGVYTYGEKADQTNASADVVLNEYDPDQRPDGLLIHLADEVLPALRNSGAYVGHLTEEDFQFPETRPSVGAAIRAKVERMADT